MKTASRKHVLITGSTSGLGRAVAERFLQKGYQVTGIARKSHPELDKHPLFRFVRCDYSSLKNVPEACREILDKSGPVDLLINNAGILSPSGYQRTPDGFEISYQVNFLAHVLLTRLLQKANCLNGMVINTSSPVYRRGSLQGIDIREETYGWFQAYSNTKLFMALWAERLFEEGIDSFSFNPGTFRSGIYRSQSMWFQKLYHLGAPFMPSAKHVANCLIKIIDHNLWRGGKVMRKSGKASDIQPIKKSEKNTFWSMVDQQLLGYANYTDPPGL